MSERKQTLQNPKAGSFFCEVLGEDLNEGNNLLQTQETNTHKCHFAASYYKSMASRTVVEYYRVLAHNNQQQYATYNFFKNMDLPRSRVIMMRHMRHFSCKRK